MLKISENRQIFVHNFGGVAKMSLVSIIANLPPRTLFVAVIVKAEPLPPTVKLDYYATGQPHEHTKQ